MTNGPVNGRKALHIFLKHLLLAARLTDLDLHKEIALFHSLFDLINGNGIGHQRNTGHLFVVMG